MRPPRRDTLEVYGALSWKFLSAKFSYVISDEAFGVSDADGTYYIDLTATYPIPNTKLTLIAHYGVQKFRAGNAGSRGTTNASPTDDWKIGVNYSLPKDFTVGLFYTDTSRADAGAVYTAAHRSGQARKSATEPPRSSSRKPSNDAAPGPASRPVPFLTGKRHETRHRNHQAVQA